jgi:hypothetical protein
MEPITYPLEAFLSELLLHSDIREEITRELGPEKSKMVFTEFNQGILSSEIQDDVYDIVSDYMADNASISEELTGYTFEDCFPILIKSFGPIHWVEAQEFDPIKYFKSASDALAFAEVEYSEFLTGEPEEEDEYEEDDSEDE